VSLHYRFKAVLRFVLLPVALGACNLTIDTARGDWLIQTYQNGSPITDLSDADNLIASTAPIASGIIDASDMLGFNSGEGTGHFSLNYPVPGITQAHATDNYAVVGTATLTVPAAGLYTFGLNTDDGARLQIDGSNVIVDSVREPPHDSTYAAIDLTAGTHSVNWTWYNAAGGNNGGGAEAEVFAAPGSYTSFNSNFKLIGTAPGAFLMSPAVPPVQKVVLDFGDPTPFNVGIVSNPLNGSVVYAHSIPGDIPAQTFLASDEPKILQDVKGLFADAGVTNIDISIGSAEPNATVVYFAQDQNNNPLAGYTKGGIDRFNQRNNDQVVVFGDINPEIDAETVAHELGHSFGLIHVDPGTYTDPSTGLKYVELMKPTTDQPDGTSFAFINEVSTGTDPAAKALHLSENPVYNLRRYIDGDSDLSLQAQGIYPGTWDVPSAVGTIAETLNFAASRTLYNVDIWSGAGDSDTLDSIAHFDQITLAELSSLPFEVNFGDSLSLTAASTPAGSLDISLTNGDPSNPDNLAIPVTLGATTATLEVVNGATYTPIADATINGVYVPEPTSLIFVALVVVILNQLSRRRLSSSYRLGQ